MAEAIAFPDAEAVAYSWLTAQLAARSDTAAVGTMKPGDGTTRFVRVLRVGGPRRNMVQDDAMVVFDCYDAEQVDASNLATLVRALVGAMVGETVDGHMVYDVTEVGGPANLPDEFGNPRYTYTAQILLRGAPI